MFKRFSRRALGALLILSSWCVSLTATPADIRDGDDGLVILPQRIELSTTAARQRLVVERVDGGLFVGQAEDGLKLLSSDPSVVKIDGTLLIPVSDGTATITANSADGKSAKAEVVVTGQSEPFVWNFRNHVESVFSKAGCNGGACHGALAGKNGFRLTLFGYDPEADYLSITHQARGRRVVPKDPGRSLLLTKPTGLIPHKGGVRLEVGSPAYDVVAQWIAAGMPPPRQDDPRLARLEVLPPHSRQSIGARQPLVVLAHFSNGHVEDVTARAKFSSVNSAVAGVDDLGNVEITGPGEGAIKAWFLNANALAFLSVPHPNQISDKTFDRAPRNNFIDDLVLAKLRQLNLPPSPPADDATFLRRAFLDTLGILPAVDEVESFAANPRPDKRQRLVDQLLTRPEFVDYWAYKWSDLLLVTGERLRPDAVKAYSRWIREQVAADTPWDLFVRRIVTASGSTLDNGAANFYALHQAPDEMAETVSQAFLGLSIGCAKCHNHPLEKWTNDQYYGLANMFSRVRAKGWGGDFRSGDGARIVFSDTQGELIQPSKGKPQPPRPLDAEPASFDDPADRRVYLARWLTSSENPYFTRAIVNRVWANYFGVGLVEKVDDVRLTNPASNEELLTAAEKFLIHHRYDLKALMREILGSAAYQRSSQVLPENRADERFYSRYYPRRLKAEVLLDAMSQVTAAPTTFKDYPAGTRALQLGDASVASYFLNTFGRPERIITCECERSDEPSMVQVLHVMNGGTLQGKLEQKQNRIDQLLDSSTSDEAIVRQLYLAALSRPPTSDESSQILTILAEAPSDERRAAWEDVFWSVLSGKEFMFNH